MKLDRESQPNGELAIDIACFNFLEPPQVIPF